MIVYIYQWTIKCIQIVGKWLYIGICAKQDPPFTLPPYRTTDDYWFMCNGCRNKHHLSDACHYYGKGYGTNDIVKVEFHTKQRNIRFYVNDEDRAIAYDGIEFEGDDVRFAILMDSEKEHVVKIIDFKIINNIH